MTERIGDRVEGVARLFWRPSPDARDDDDMTCARCGGHFQRWEGVDTPEPTCPWCLVESRFRAEG